MKKRKVVITFPPHLINEPVSYHLIKDYDLRINILKARVVPREEGRLVVELNGKGQSLKEAEDYLAGLGVRIEPLAQEVKFLKDRCTSCTVCIPLCPTEALSLDRKQMLVDFHNDKCIVCGLCVPACPFRAIEVMF